MGLKQVEMKHSALIWIFILQKYGKTAKEGPSAVCQGRKNLLWEDKMQESSIFEKIFVGPMQGPMSAVIGGSL